MGVGEEALGAHLASEGVARSPACWRTSANERARVRAATPSTPTCVGWARPSRSRGDARLAGPVVLQGGGRDGRLRPSRGARDPRGRPSGRPGADGRSGADGDARRLSSASSPPRMLRRRVDGWRPRAGRRRARNHACRRGQLDPQGSKVLVPPNAVLQNSRHPAAARRRAPGASRRPRRGLVATGNARARGEDAPTPRRIPRGTRPRIGRTTRATPPRPKARRGRDGRRPSRPDEVERRGRPTKTAPPGRRLHCTWRSATPRRGSFRAGDRRFPDARATRRRGGIGRGASEAGSRFRASPPSAEVRKASARKAKPSVAARARPALPPRRRDVRLRRRSRRPQHPTRTRDVANACCLDSWSRPGRARRAVGREGEGRGGGGRGRGERRQTKRTRTRSRRLHRRRRGRLATTASRLSSSTCLAAVGLTMTRPRRLRDGYLGN